MTEMYLSDKDLVLEARRFQAALTEVSNEVQQLIFLNSTLTKCNPIEFKFCSVLNFDPRLLQPIDDFPREAASFPCRHPERTQNPTRVQPARRQPTSKPHPSTKAAKLDGPHCWR